MALQIEKSNFNQVSQPSACVKLQEGGGRTLQPEPFIYVKLYWVRLDIKALRFQVILFCTRVSIFGSYHHNY